MKILLEVVLSNRVDKACVWIKPTLRQISTRLLSSIQVEKVTCSWRRSQVIVFFKWLETIFGSTISMVTREGVPGDLQFSIRM